MLASTQMVNTIAATGFALTTPRWSIAEDEIVFQGRHRSTERALVACFFPPCTGMVVLQYFVILNCLGMGSRMYFDNWKMILGGSKPDNSITLPQRLKGVCAQGRCISAPAILHAFAKVNTQPMVFTREASDGII